MARSSMFAAAQSLGIVGGNISDGLKVLDWPLLDTVYTEPSGSHEISFFTDSAYLRGPLAGTDKTLGEYNIDTEGALAVPNSHKAIGFQLHIMADVQSGLRPSQAAVRNLINWGHAQFLLGDGQRTYECLLQRMGGPRYKLVGNSLSTVFTFGMGWGEVPNAWLRMGEYVQNDADAFFQVVFKFSRQFDVANELEDGMRLRLALPGYLDTRTG